MEIPEFLKKWRLNVSKQQQTFYSLLGDRDWDELDRNHKDFKSNLKIKISLALFAKTFTKCSVTEQTQIDATIETLFQLCGSGNVILIGYTYVHILTESGQESILPLIRVESKYNHKPYYFEIQPGKIYDGWDAFLNSNNIPEAYLCYPKDGYYAPQSDKLVCLEFDKSNNENFGSKVNDFPVSIFFPFYKTVGKAEIIVGLRLTHILMNKSVIEEDPFDVINDKNFMASWLNSIIHDVGNVGIETETTTSMVLQSNIYFVAVRLFRCVYNTSPKVNTSKFIISLMTIMLKQKIGKCKPDDYNEFLSCLVFFLNFTTEIHFVKEIILKLNEKPLQIQNFFSTHLNYKFTKKLTPIGCNSKPTKKSKCDVNAYGVCYVLKEICELERNPNSNVDAVSAKIVNYIKSVKNALKKDSPEFWINFNKTLYPIFTEYVDEISKNHLSMKWLQSKWNKIGFPKKEVYDMYFNYALPSLSRRIFRRLHILGENVFSQEALQVRLLSYCLELSLTVHCRKDEQFFDILAIVVEKFVSWYNCLAVALKAKNNNDRISQIDLENIIGKIFVKLKEPSVIKQFKEDYQELYKMKRAPFLGEPAFSCDDVELYYYCQPEPSSFPDVLQNDIVSVEFFMNATHYLLQTEEPNDLLSLKSFFSALQITYKSNVVIIYRRKHAGKLHGFLAKIVY